MMNSTYALSAILIMAAVTALLRFIPFLVMGNRKTPAYVEYLGKVLPYAVMAMLVVYCLKGVDFTVAPFGVCEFISVGVVVGIHVWKRNTLLSIVLGTLCYMLLIRIM
ncbi:MAG: AzlD domain-containing protein [Clostridia bacterium]|nr:AzlD domain-containing protein [Clostridia bacterium]